MIPILWRASLRDLTRHRWQTALSILGIALGVGVVIAVDIANESARRSFELSVERVAGRATHHIESATGRISDAQFARLAPHLAALDASPVIEATVRIGPGTFTLLGLDPLAASRLNPIGGDAEGSSLGGLMADPGALLLARRDAERLGARPGDPLRLSADGVERPAHLAGVLSDHGGGTAAEMAGLALADIATAQELTGRVGWIDRVDLALSPGQEQGLAGQLPAGLRLTPAAQRSESLRQMTRAFRTNLTAMSLLALLVGGFIVYNTMTFAVLRRRALLGSLRTLGCTRRQLFALVLSEAMILALVGSLIGVALGIVTGWGLVQLVIRTINDIYFALTVGALQLPPGSLVAGIALGLLVTLVAALGPATEAARSQPRDLLRPGSLERRGHRWVLALGAAGVALLALGWGLAEVPSRSMGVGFLSLLLVVVGYSLCVPALLRVVAAAIAGVAAANRDWAGAMPVLLAARGIGASITRTGIAVAALTVAVAATVGVGIMIESFRDSLIQWLETTLQSDIYVSTPNETGGRPAGRLPGGLPARLAALPGVAEVSQGRRVQITAATGSVALLALQPSAASRRGFRFDGETSPDLWPGFDSGELILASEPFAYHHQVAVGDRVGLFTARGWQDFGVGGIFRDYGSDSGMLVMARPAYAALWDDPSVTTVGLVLAPGADPDELHGRVLALTEAGDDPLLVSRNREIREQSLAIFDRTFAVTRVLRWLAVGVAFVGVLSALMALQLELRRDHAVMRATGLTRRELTLLVLIQTSILGLAAGLFAVPLGTLLGDLLIQVVNVRSFGWTMDLRVPSGTLFGGLLLAWSAALLAGLYPALRAARVAPAEALRSE